MNLRKIFLCSFLAVLCLSSCNKEEITIDDPIIINDPPIEIEYPVAKGITINEDGPLSDVKVSVYQNGILKGNTFSDKDGQFNTSEVLTEDDKDLILVLEKEDYSQVYRKRSVDFLKEKPLKIELINADDIYGPTSSINTPSAEDHITLSGYIKDLQGAPSNGYIAIEYEVLEDNVPTMYGISSKTDSDGYYEFLLAKNTELRVSIFSDVNCFKYFTNQEVTIFLNLQAEKMGPFPEDVILDDYINPYTSVLNLSLSGEILTCEGEEPSGASVTIEINDNEDNHYFREINNLENGLFSYTENDCLNIPYSVKITGRDQGNNKLSDVIEFVVENVDYVSNNIQLEACNQIDAGFSTATMSVGGATYEFNQILTRYENTNLIADEFTDSYAKFLIPDAKMGMNAILNFELGDFFGGSYFKAVNNSMDLTISEITTNSAIGEVSGDFLDVNGQTVTGTCILNLKF